VPKDLEGIVAKPKDSPYDPERTKGFKIKNPQYSQREGQREMFNSFMGYNDIAHVRELPKKCSGRLGRPAVETIVNCGIGILRAKNDVTRRAERRLRHDLVWAGNRLRRAVERQCCGDQIIPNRCLSETDGRGENGDDECCLHSR
jgi:hypothetical protein